MTCAMFWDRLDAFKKCWKKNLSLSSGCNSTICLPNCSYTHSIHFERQKQTTFDLLVSCLGLTGVNFHCAHVAKVHFQLSNPGCPLALLARSLVNSWYCTLSFLVRTILCFVVVSTDTPFCVQNWFYFFPSIWVLQSQHWTHQKLALIEKWTVPF